MSVTRLCSGPNCPKKHFCKGFCRPHYERWKRHGDPTMALKKMSARGAPLAWIENHADHTGQDCLIWPFARFPDGRAHMRSGKPSRIMCERAHGSAPSEKHQAAHSCGQAYAGCVNPTHLRWATPKENSADKEEHGTVVRGARHYGAKLNPEKVREIRAMAGVRLQREIAEMFGVHLTCINKVLSNRAWRHVA